MTNIELVINMFAEASSTEISKCKDKQGFNEAEQKSSKRTIRKRNRKKDYNGRKN